MDNRYQVKVNPFLQIGAPAPTKAPTVKDKKDREAQPSNKQGEDDEKDNNILDTIRRSGNDAHWLRMLRSM